MSMVGNTFFHIRGKNEKIVKEKQNMNSARLKQWQQIKQTSGESE